MTILLFQIIKTNRMNIEINDRRKIYTIQNEFSKQYPNLKIEFYSKPHKKGGAVAKKLVKRASKTLGECRTIHNSGKMNISSGLTISELEQYFAGVYGLGIKVSVKFGRSWIAPSTPGKLSLGEQNNKAE